MQWWTSSTVLLLVLLLSASSETGAQGTLEFDGNELLRQCAAAMRVMDNSGQGDTSTKLQASWCLGYVRGFADGHTGATVDAATGAVLCPPDGWRPTGQLVRILVNWLRAHPTWLHEPMHGLMLLAFAEAFPCPSRVPRPSTPKAGKEKQW